MTTLKLPPLRRQGRLGYFLIAKGSDQILFLRAIFVMYDDKYQTGSSAYYLKLNWNIPFEYIITTLSL